LTFRLSVDNARLQISERLNALFNECSGPFEHPHRLAIATT
jgi:hypothetical protein